MPASGQIYKDIVLLLSSLVHILEVESHVLSLNNTLAHVVQHYLLFSLKIFSIQRKILLFLSIFRKGFLFSLLFQENRLLVGIYHDS